MKEAIQLVHDETNLLIAAETGNDSLIETLLRSAKVNLEATDFIGRNALHLMMMTGSERGITMLLKAGVDVMAKDKLGRTPLSLLLMRRPSLRLAELLFRYGADLLPRVSPMDTGLFLQFIMMCTPTKEEEKIIRFLVEKGGLLDDPMAPGKRQALHFAAMSNNCELIRILVDLGANPYSQNHRNETPRQVAQIFKCKQAADMLAEVEKHTHFLPPPPPIPKKSSLSLSLNSIRKQNSERRRSLNPSFKDIIDAKKEAAESLSHFKFVESRMTHAHFEQSISSTNQNVSSSHIRKESVDTLNNSKSQERTDQETYSSTKSLTLVKKEAGTSSRWLKSKESKMNHDHFTLSTSSMHKAKSSEKAKKGSAVSLHHLKPKASIIDHDHGQSSSMNREESSVQLKKAAPESMICLKPKENRIDHSTLNISSMNQKKPSTQHKKETEKSLSSSKFKNYKSNQTTSNVSSMNKRKLSAEFIRGSRKSLISFEDNKFDQSRLNVTSMGQKESLRRLQSKDNKIDQSTMRISSVDRNENESSEKFKEKAVMPSSKEESKSEIEKSKLNISLMIENQSSTSQTSKEEKKGT